jgi:D-lactate dehydrogenase
VNVAVFSSQRYDRIALEQANAGRHQLHYLESHLDVETAALARGCAAVCVDVNDTVNAAVLERLALQAIPLVALRCAGFNNIDIAAAKKLGMTIVRVPAYSRHAVAEHTIALMLALNRKLHRAYNRVREGNFARDGLLGFDLNGRTAGVIGAGKIGCVVAQILRVFGCEVIAFDPWPSEECRAFGVEYVSLDELLAASDIITLHCPLSAENHHLIDAAAVEKMKPGVMLINTSRSGLLDMQAVIDGLKSGRIGYLGLDVYEEESELFFEDLSRTILREDVFTRLLTFPNVMITGHQGFFTREALANVAATTIANISEFEMTGASANAIKFD